MTLSPGPGQPSATADPLLIGESGGVRTLTFNRPAAFNSFNLAHEGGHPAAR